MKQLLILQFRTDQSLVHEQELFKKYFSEFNITFYDLFNDDSKKINTDDFDALIVSGSGQFDLTTLSEEKLKSIEDNSHIIKNFVNEDKPTLGICFGHQLIAVLMGGEVVRDEAQSETGTIEVFLTEAGRKSKIFKNMPEAFFVAEGHKEVVSRMPEGATLLAYSRNAENQGYRIGKKVYTVQFHPEFKLEDLLFRLSLYPEYMKDKTLEDIKAEHKEMPHAYKVLENFRDVVEQS